MPDRLGIAVANSDSISALTATNHQLFQNHHDHESTETMLATRSSLSLLPELKTNNSMDQKKGPSFSVQQDYIPEELLFALTQPPPVSDSIGPPGRQRNLAVTNLPYRKNAANLWSHPKRREKFKHLTNHTPCVCGAGKDISFLYDVPKADTTEEVSTSRDKSAVRARESQEKKPQALALPDTLIPKEYHMVKNKGVLGLEYHEDKYALRPVDHEKHLVVFPSMKPTSRYEVIQLKKTLEKMLEELGIEAEYIENLKGPTQMHNLLEVIKKEQNVYNIIFHEIIRQVSVECVERGELLADVRDRYSKLFSQVPQQVKSIHEEVLAQRALDRRLTEELMRFKTTIGSLTDELSQVKAHDKQVTKEAALARSDLKEALAESQKSTGLLAEYHDLYELQRKRMQHSVQTLSEEKEIWSTAAYSLALKVTEEHSLNTARRLHVSEKSWIKLATHFTIMLNDKDTDTLTQIQSFVDQWRDIIEDFDTTLRRREDAIKENIRQVQEGLQKWAIQLRAFMLNKEGFIVNTPGREKIEELFHDLRGFEQSLTSQSEKLGGDTMLKGQESMLKVRRMMEGWTDAALQVFVRHRGEDGANFREHDEMTVMNEEVDELLSQYQVRLTGENGSATSLIHLASAMDGWQNKFNPFVLGSNPIPDQEWMRFLKALSAWDAGLNETHDIVSSTQREEDRKEGKLHKAVELPAVVRQTQKWLDSTTNGIDSEDGKLMEQVSKLHTEMVKWMVQILLRLAPDPPNHSEQAREAVLLGSTTLGELQANAKSLFINLESFSKFVIRCCTGIVVQLAQEKRDRHEEKPDSEYKDLMKLKTECEAWIYTAKILLCELTGDPLNEVTPKASKDSFMTLTPTPPKLQETIQSMEREAEEEEERERGREEREEENEEEKRKQVGEARPDVTIDEGQDEPRDLTVEGSTSDVTLPKRQGTPSQPGSIQPSPQSTPGISPGGSPGGSPGETIEILGTDAYTHKTTIPSTHNAPPIDPPDRPMSQRTKGRDNTPNTKKAYEGLSTINSLQTQLLASEERAQVAEERSSDLEAKLKEAEERIAVLEKKEPQVEAAAVNSDKPETSESKEEIPKTEVETPTKSEKDTSPSTSVATVTLPSPSPPKSPSKSEKKGKKSAGKKRK